VFASALAITEALECAALFYLASRHLSLVFRVDSAATKAVILSSLPFYLNVVACTAYGKLDVSWLAFVAPSTEVGFYAGASSIAALTLFATPLIAWVLTPAFAKAASRARAELEDLARRSTELILTIVIPVSLLVGLGADVWVRLLFGEAYAPASLGLRILAPTFVVTYVAIVYATTLLMVERAWTLTAISCAGLVVNVVLNALLDRRAIELLGPGGGGAGCALAMLGTELFVTASMIQVLSPSTFGILAKSLGACALVTVAHLALSGLGPVRLAVDLALYLSVVVLAGALRPREIAVVLGEAISRKRAA
jgi:O-antigen/teichoic acid export membrane protein